MSGPEHKSLLSSVKIQVPEERYRADLELLDRYINFSAEIVRLSLAVMAGVGIILGYLFNDGKYIKPHFEWAFNGCLIFSFFFLTCALAFALLHRYYASDGFYHHIRAIKYLIRAESEESAEPDVAANVIEKARNDEAYRNKKFDQSGIFLGISSLSLLLGVFGAGATIGSLLIGGA